MLERSRNPSRPRAAAVGTVPSRLAALVAASLLALAAAVLAAPAAGAAAAGTPFGNFERATGIGGAIQVQGWAIDPDTTAPVYVWLTVDGVGRHLYAGGPRPDVGAAFPGSGADHGFTAALPASTGRHVVCVSIHNVGPGEHGQLGCRAVTVRTGSPLGNLEAARGRPGTLEVSGWALDPDSAEPTYAWVSIDGAGRHVRAGGSRPDVATAFPGYGPNHGFSFTTAVPDGTHTVCVNVHNLGPGSHTSLGCHQVTSGWTSSVATIDAALATRMRSSWRTGCPMPLSGLRYLTMTYRGFDGYDHLGEMVVAAGQAPAVLQVFERLHEVGFPIFRMRLVDDYGGDDNASMAADNTSAFNCRAVTGGTSFSRHSYGDAIDVNPRENPYVRGSTVLPPSGAPYVNRPDLPGVIHDGDDVVRAFADIGWSWGGHWTTPKDYQHFTLTGR